MQFALLLVQSGVCAFLAAEKALSEMQWTLSWGKTTVTLEPVGVAGLITAWNANALFVCLKLDLRRRRGLHRRNQAQRVKLVADAGFDRGAP